jgi:hypothetical protein
MPIAISAVTPPAATSGQSEPALQAGTTVEARVVQVTDAMARIAIANTLIDVMSDAPLAVGEVLRLAVSQTPTGVRLAIVARTLPEGMAGAPPQGLVEIDAPAIAPGKTAAEPSSRPPADPAVPRDALVTRLVRDNVGRQASLAPFFADLAEAARQGNLPPRLGEVAAQLLALRPALGENLTVQDLRLAVAQAAPFSPSAGKANQAAAMPELKAALVVFRQILSTWLGSPDASAPATRASLPTAWAPRAPAVMPAMAASAASADAAVAQGLAQPPTNVSAPAGTAGPATSTPSIAASAIDAEIAALGATARHANAAISAGSTPAAAALALLQEVQQATRELARATVEGKTGALDPLARPIRPETASPNGDARPVQPVAGNPPPPFRGGAQAPQPVAASSVTPDMTVADVGHKLLDEVDGAIARQTLLQVASLPDRADGATRGEAAGPRWNFEIPFATPQGTAVAQFEIAREGKREEAGEVKPVWQARFTIGIEPVGPVHAQILLAGERASVRLWAERPTAATALRENMSELSRALREAELVPGDILVGEGTPTRTQAAAAAAVRAGRYLDRAT